MKKRVVFLLMACMTMSLLTACGSKPDSGTSGSSGEKQAGNNMVKKIVTSDEPVIIYSDTEDLAPGPNGEKAASVKELDLTDKQVEDAKAAGYTCALLTGGSGDGWNAFKQGVHEQCDELGIEIVFEAEGNFDAAKQATDVETAMALEPDILVTMPVDSTAGAEVFRPAVEAGCKLVFLGNGVDGYTAGNEYVTLISGDYYGMGGTPADLIAEAIGGSGDIGMIYYDVNYYTTNMRDSKFESVIAEKYPDINIAAKQGFTVESDTAEPTNALMLQNPDIKAIYVSWDVAAENVISELRALGREDVKVVTVDLGDTNDLDMAQRGIMYGKTAEPINSEGKAMIRAAVKDLSGEKVGPYYVSEYLVVTRDNLWKSFELAQGKDLPKNIKNALQEK